MTDNNSSLYLKVKVELLSSFKSLSYYSMIPGERELSEKFKVSRPTIRKALKELEDEKLIMRIHGKGSFFMGNRIHIDSSRSNGIAFYDDVKARGRYTKSKVLLQNIANPPKEVAKILQINDSELVFHLERLRYIGDELYSLANAYVPLKFCKELLNYDYTNISLYETLEKHGVFPYVADKILEIKPADDYEAMHLQIKKGDPVSVMESITYDRDGNVIEYAIAKSLSYKTRYEMVAYNYNQSYK